jgi:pyridinium-3,5-bisthiocarboxylic acid mononucleotide nickel chelatase
VTTPTAHAGTSRRLCYLDCVGGLAGDMLLAALVDAGADLEKLRRLPAALGLEGVGISVERVERQGVGALHLDVEAPDDAHDRDYREIRRLVQAADLPDAVRTASLATFARLAEVEGAIHGVPPDEVHFHELGSLDTLVDVCGAHVLLADLEVFRVACSPLPFARGLTRAAHGVLPLPAPATLALLQGAPLVGVETEAELVTPTGAALAATLVDEWGTLPPLTLDGVGYGAGAKDFADRPNVVRVVVGSEAERPGGRAVLLETNLDDFPPELVPDAVERCFAAGALDVWTAPAQMKKGRPGFVLSALARPGAETGVARALLEETTALGVRTTRVDRWELDREERTVEVTGGSVRLKVGLLDGKVVNLAPEHDDCAAVARRTGRPVKSVWAEALARAREP